MTNVEVVRVAGGGVDAESGVEVAAVMGVAVATGVTGATGALVGVSPTAGGGVEVAAFAATLTGAVAPA
jgi:hypothetical protein